MLGRLFFCKLNSEAFRIVIGIISKIAGIRLSQNDKYS